MRAHLTWDPQPEKPIATLTEKGKYNFKVVKGEDVFAKTTGAPMVKICMKYWDKNGDEKLITENFLVSVLWKLEQFCQCVGLEEKFNSREFCAEDAVDRVGVFDIDIQEAKGEYGARNIVKRFIPASFTKALKSIKNTLEEKNFPDDDISF